MGIFEKIEEVRQKPEHIRVRYVWACVAISMIFVLALWIFSFRTQELSGKLPIDTTNFPDTNIAKKSLQDITDQFQKTSADATNNGNLDTSNSDNTNLNSNGQ
jgi:hypothetical protein